MSTLEDHGTIAIPEAPHQIPPTPLEEIDKAVAEVRAQRDAWLDVDIAARIRILDQLVEATKAHIDEWADRDGRVKRIPEDSPASGEPITNGPWILLRGCQALRQSLQEILDHGRPQIPGEMYTRDGGQVVAPVFPRNWYERIVLPGFEGEVWMEPDQSVEEVRDRQASAYRGERPETGTVRLVLGAGNVAAIPFMDSISKLFQHNEVVVLKMNPVNEHVGPVLEKVLHPLIERDFLRIIYGGIDEGKHLTEHDGIDAIHMTGSDKTFEAIMFGPGEEGRRRIENREPPITDKPVTAELGNVTPVIVVPGPWSKKDLDFHGENIATGLVNNVGFNCIANRVVLTHASWSKRRDLVDRVSHYLAQAPERYPYYPGAEDRWERFVDEHPEAEQHGRHSDNTLPWTFIRGLDESVEDEIAFHTEAFAPVMGEVPLDAPRSVADYIDRAVEFCNERLWGTLAVSIIVHPRSLKDPEISAAVDRAIANLEYGTIVVNHWPAATYVMGTTAWGGYPNSDIYDIQSGTGFVHNFLMFDRPQKSVVRGSFRLPTKPPWFLTFENSHRIFRAVAELEANPSAATLGKLAWALVRP